MKKYIYPEQKTCMMRFKNRRVYVQRQPDDSFYVGIKRINKHDEKVLIFSDIRKPNQLSLEVTETGILLSPEAAFALVKALQEMILLSDIPIDCLVLNNFKD